MGSTPHSGAYEDKTPSRAPAHASAGGGLLRILKPGQGKHVRWGTALGAGILAVAGAQFIREQLRLINVGEQFNEVFQLLVPVALLVLAAFGIFWAVGRKQVIVDFLIATEGEMKKVNWSTPREVWGATKVVILTVFALGLILAIVDFLFMAFFSGINVLQIDVIKKLVGGGDV